MWIEYTKDTVRVDSYAKSIQVMSYFAQFKSKTKPKWNNQM